MLRHAPGRLVAIEPGVVAEVQRMAVPGDDLTRLRDMLVAFDRLAAARDQRVVVKTGR